MLSNKFKINKVAGVVINNESNLSKNPPWPCKSWLESFIFAIRFNLDSNKSPN